MAQNLLKLLIRLAALAGEANDLYIEPN